MKLSSILQNGTLRTLIPIVALAIVVLVVVVITGKSSPSQPKAKGSAAVNVLAGNPIFNVKDPKPAPEITGINEWVNSNGETIKNLKGKVVLIDFWTYSCINCLRTLPHVTGWYEKYKDKGFVVIGVHAPEFAFEHQKANVIQATKDNHINYPVGLDNDLSTWDAFSNQYWPAEYFIDRNGFLRHTHFGEGEYDKNEQVIQALLKEGGQTLTDKVDADNSRSPVAAGQTPETYLGFERGQNFANVDQFVASKTVNYTLKDGLTADQWSLGGAWQVGAKDTLAKGGDSKLRIKFSAKEVYLVMDGPGDKPVTLTLNGQPVKAGSSGGSDVDANGELHFNGARLYRLVTLPSFMHDQVLDISLPEGATINAFTFGA